MDVKLFMKKSVCSGLFAMLVSFVLPISPVHADTGAYTHVISQTATGLIDTVYTAQHVVFAVNVVPSVSSTPYVYYGGESTGAVAADGSVSFPIEDSPPTTQGGAPLGSVINVPFAAPSVAPGYTGLGGMQMYEVYNTSGTTIVARTYVQFWYSNGALTNISLNTQPVSTGPGPGCTPAPGRPCKQPDAVGSNR